MRNGFPFQSVLLSSLNVLKEKATSATFVAEVEMCKQSLLHINDLDVSFVQQTHQ